MASLAVEGMIKDSKDLKGSEDSNTLDMCIKKEGRKRPSFSFLP